MNIFEIPSNINKGFVTLTEFNFYEDLKLILNKYWEEIAQYKATSKFRFRCFEYNIP